MKMLGRIVAMTGSTINTELTDDEFKALLEALRRDLRHERELAHCSDNCSGCKDTEAYFHGRNARMDIRILETLQPKKPQPLPTMACPVPVSAAAADVVELGAMDKVKVG